MSHQRHDPPIPDCGWKLELIHRSLRLSFQLVTAPFVKLRFGDFLRPGHVLALRRSLSRILCMTYIYTAEVYKYKSSRQISFTSLSF